MDVYIPTIILTVFFASLATFFSKQIVIEGVSVTEPNRFFAALVGMVLILVGGLRWRVGTDYWEYSWGYEGYVKEVWGKLISYDEPGIRIIAWISSHIYDDYGTMFFLFSIVTISLFVITIYKYSSKMFVFSILLFIFIGAWHGSFNGVRQFAACAIIFAGHRLIFERKLWKYLLVILIAGMFHLSAIGMLLLYFVPKKELELKHLAILLGGTFLLINSYGIIFEFIEGVRENSVAGTAYAQTEVSLFRVLVAFAPIIVYFTLTKRQNMTNEDFFYINLLFVNAVIALVTSQSAYLARFATYTNCFVAIGLPRLINFDKSSLAVLMKVLIVLAYAAFWYFEITKSGDLVNFRWIFNRTD